MESQRKMNLVPHTKEGGFQLVEESLYLVLTWRGNPFIQSLPGEGIPLSSSYLERESLVYPSKQFIFVWSFYEEVGLTLYSQLSNWYMTRDLETYILVQQLCTRKLKSVISFHSKFPVCASNVLPKKKDETCNYLTKVKNF